MAKIFHVKDRATRAMYRENDLARDGITRSDGLEMFSRTTGGGSRNNNPVADEIGALALRKLSEEIKQTTLNVKNLTKEYEELKDNPFATPDFVNTIKTNLEKQNKLLKEQKQEYEAITNRLKLLDKTTKVATAAFKIASVAMIAISIASSRLAREITQVGNATGIATDEILKMQSGFSALTGIDDASNSLRKFADVQDLVNFRLRLGQQPTLEYYLAVNKLGGAILETGKFTLETYEAFRQYDRGTRLSIASQLGLGEAIIRAADEGRTAQEVNAAGIVQTEMQIAQNRELNQSWLEMRNDITQTALTIAEKFKPEMEGALNLVTQIASGIASFVSNNKDLVKVVGTVVLALATLRAAMIATAVVQSFLTALVPGGIGLVAQAGITAGIVATTFGIAGYAALSVLGGGKNSAEHSRMDSMDAERAADRRSQQQIMATNRVETAIVASQAARLNDLLLQPLTAARGISMSDVARGAGTVDDYGNGTLQNQGAAAISKRLSYLNAAPPIGRLPGGIEGGLANEPGSRVGATTTQITNYIEINAPTTSADDLALEVGSVVGAVGYGNAP